MPAGRCLSEAEAGRVPASTLPYAGIGRQSSRDAAVPGNRHFALATDVHACSVGDRYNDTVE